MPVNEEEKAAKARDAALKGALTQIEREFGKGTVMRMGDEGAQVRVDAIPTGALSLDLALGIGGVPKGRIVEVFGPESSGKTTLIYHVLAEAQKLGGVCAFIDAEHAMDPLYAQEIGVDIDELLVSQPDYGEQGLEVADMLVRSGAVDVVAIDSVAALTPRKELEGQMEDTSVGEQARMMSKAMRKLAGNLNRTQTLCILTNQIREKVGVMFGSPETQPGGRALKFYASQRLDIRRIETLKDGTEAVGNRVRVKVVKNKVRRAIQAGRVRHRVRQRHLHLRVSARPRDRAQHRVQVGLVLLLRRGSSRPGPRRRQGPSRRQSRGRQGDRAEDLRGARHRPRARDADRPRQGRPARGDSRGAAGGRSGLIAQVGDHIERSSRSRESRVHAPSMSGEGPILSGAMKRYHLTTFGCQMNEHDSEHMKGMLESLGYSEAPERGEADLILFNTCSIRESADSRFIAHLGEAKRLKSEQPERVVGVGGCWAQSVKEEVFERFPFVDVAFGPGQVHKLAEFLTSDSLSAQGYFEFEGFTGPPAGTPRAPVPGLAADQRGLQLRVLVLHRALHARAGGLATAARARRRGAGDGAGRRARGDAARAERQLLRARPATGARRRSRSCWARSTRSRGSSASATRARTRRTCART